MRTLYRLADISVFDKMDLPWRRKRRPNRQKETRVKQAFHRELREKADIYPDFQKEFGHLEGVTIAGEKDKSLVISYQNAFQMPSSHRKPMDGKQMILRPPLIIGCLKFLDTSLSRSLLIMGKNFLIGSLFRMRMTLIFLCGSRMSWSKRSP